MNQVHIYQNKVHIALASILLYFHEVLAQTKKIQQSQRSITFYSGDDRNNHSQVFFKIGVLQNFATFTGKHLCWSLIFKKRPQHRCFPVNNAKYLRIAVFMEYFWWLLLR